MTTATAATVAAPFALELQALKADLQRTLARLGTAPVTVREAPASPWSHTSTTTATTANTTTPTTVRSDAMSRRSRASPSQSEMTERILHELVATARRRRQVEMHMARELERELRVREDDLSILWGRSARDPSRVTGREGGKESAIQSEIEALRLRRKQILVEIDNESKSEEPAASQGPLTMQDRSSESSARDADVSNVSASIKRHNENEYSIEGVVKLGSLMHRKSNQEAASQTSPSLSRHHGPSQHAPQVPSFEQSQLYGGYRNQHHDKMMQDVFAIQLKFAETMLQLEKSIQTRDQLLVSTATDRARRRSITSRRSAAVSMRRRTRLPSTIHEDRERNPADSSDDESGLSHALSSDDASMSEDTMRMWRRYRRRSASSPGTAPESVTTTTTTSTSPHSQPSPGQANDHDSASPLVSTPSDELLVTPTTNDSGNKQVHFHDTTDDYPTPLVARNISFDQDSIDSTDDDQAYARAMRRTMTTPTLRAATRAPRKRLTVVSWDEDDALSFLEGSSVCSADLQDESFLAAFYALRRELLGDRLGTQTPSTPTSSFPTLTANSELAEATTTSQRPESTVPTTYASVSLPTVAAADVAALQRQKRGLMLDIQASTAKLVLAQDAAQREQATAALDRLRRQLQTIEAQEAAAAPS